MCLASYGRVHGGLFDNEEVLPLHREGVAILDHVVRLDWGSIEPAILGTLFERSLDPGKRAQLGAHYTSREDILLIVEPVLMAPLRRRWAAVQEEARALAARRDEADTTRTRENRNRELLALLRGFAEEIAAVRVLDPACGSGNFLYVALKQLLDLEKEVIVFAAEVAHQRFQPGVGPEQLYGIEVNEYAHELAQTTVWIGYIQWLRDNGFGLPSEPILKPIERIRRMDAILGRDEQGRLVEPAWPEADVIIGNPPFLGSRKMRPMLGNEYCDALLKLYEGRIEGLPDLVCYWFERARSLIAKQEVRRAGLLATQAIRGGANRQVLDQIKETGDIFMAWSDREWVLDGAMVHVSLVGFDDGTEQARSLDGKQVESINTDLTSAVDLSQVQALEENKGVSFQGVVLRGPFNITAQQANEMLANKGNPNGRPNSDVIKPRRTGQDMVGVLSNSYVVDFGVDMPIEEASEYVAPFEYLRANVYPMRQEANQAVAREKWWIHWNPRTQMREALAELPRYIATPRVAKHRIFAWLDGSILPDAQLVVFARSDDYFFGVLHSKLHELWARRMGTQLRDAESGFRYTSTTTFETFPFPWPPGREPQGDARVEAIAQAARDLNEKRERWLNPEGATEAELRRRTLTNLYNARPSWLDLAHERLDRAVLDAYGWPHDLSDEAILERLLMLNQERAGGEN
jgi:type II restriction/modification system DNA methylase subunit YeeA